MDCQKNTTHHIMHEKHTIENKTNKDKKKPGTTHCLGCKDYTDNFKPQKKSLEKNQTVLFVNLVNQEF